MVKSALFGLAHHLLQSRSTSTYFAPALYFLSLLLHLFLYLSMPLMGVLRVSALLTGLTLLALSSVSTLLILAQVVVFLAKKKEAYLSQQLMVFRFVLAPLLTLTLMQAATSKQLPVPLAIMLLLITKALSSVLSRSVLNQSHRDYSLSIIQSPIVAELDTLQTILVLNLFTTAGPIQMLFAFAALAAALITAYNHFTRVESEEVAYRILHLDNIVHIVFSSFYLFLIVFPSMRPAYFFLALLPALAYALFTAHSTSTTARDNLEKALLQQLSFTEFVESIDCFLMAREKRKAMNYIYSVLCKHGEKCGWVGCELRTLSTQEELRQMTGKNLQQLTHKIIRKVEWILQQYQAQHPEDIHIQLALLKLYTHYHPSRPTMHALLNQIDPSNLGWELQCQLHSYRAVCEGMVVLDSLEVEKGEEVQLQFRSAMVSTLGSIVEFWGEFNEERVDLGRVMQIAVRLFPSKARVERIFRQQLEERRFAAFQILKLYADYSHKILKRGELASKLEDLLGTLANWLRDNQDIHYLSKQSEAGIIIICLGEGRLSDIFMVNERACDLFHYSRKQMLGLRVNTIMPSVFADIHDRILVDFLRKKRKKYNTDQRVLFGKDGNGYIFPLKLQLQKASYSSKDEFIFIASLAPEKLRGAPVYCVVDLEGQITDCTSSFRNIFFSRQKRASTRSIQEIIPGYFEGECADPATEVRHFQSFINNAKLGEVEVSFTVSPIVVKGEHQGYLLKMTYENQRTASAYKNLRFTDNLRSLMVKGAVQGRLTHYNEHSNAYEMEKTAHRLSLKPSPAQFTLPFLNYEDVQMFANSTEVKQYGKDIKTIRYVGSHFERIEEDQSFHSESMENEGKVDIKTKIEELKHRFNHKEESSTTAPYKVAANAILAIIIALALSLYSVYQAEVAEELTFLANLNSQKEVLYCLPEYVVSFTCAGAGINPSYFSQHLLAIKPALIRSVEGAALQQEDKENIMRIIYLQSTLNLDSVFQSQAFVLPDTDSSVTARLNVIWGFMGGMSLVLLGVFGVMFYRLKQAFLNIYTVFLSISDSSIKKIEEACRQLIDEINCTGRGRVEREEGKGSEQEEEDNQIQKIKQFKNSKRGQDAVLFCKVAAPLLLLSAFLFAMLALSNTNFTHYLQLKDRHNTLLDTIPASSIELTKLILRATNNLTLTVDNHYAFYYQQLQRTILHFNQLSQRSQFLDFLYGNICINSPSVTTDAVLLCSTLANGILRNGIAPSMSFIASELRWAGVSGKMSASTIELLFQLQFLFVNPALLVIQGRMQEMLVGQIEAFGSLFTWMVLLLICLLIGFDFYLFWFPLRSIDSEMKLTNELITLMPDSASLTRP